MGCGSNKAKTTPVNPNDRTDSLVGKLHVTVVSVKYNKQGHLKNPNVSLLVSNQSHRTKKPLVSVQDINKEGEAFIFTINSFYKPQGRILQGAVCDDTDIIAHGSVDINPIINKRGDFHEFRVILTQNRQQYGSINLKAFFQELPTQEITFRFQKANIRRKTSSFGNLKAAVRVTIGEEILQTTFEADTEQQPPIWKDQLLNFKFPKNEMKGYLELIDQDYNVIGSSELDLLKMLQSESEKQVVVSEDLFYQKIDAAHIKYDYIVGKDHTFSIIKDVLKSKVVVTRQNAGE